MGFAAFFSQWPLSAHDGNFQKSAGGTNRRFKSSVSTEGPVAHLYNEALSESFGYFRTSFERLPKMQRETKNGPKT